MDSVQLSNSPQAGATGLIRGTSVSKNRKKKKTNTAGTQDSAAPDISAAAETSNSSLNVVMQEINTAIAIVQATDKALHRGAEIMASIFQMAEQSLDRFCTPTSRNAMQEQVSGLVSELNELATDTETNEPNSTPQQKQRTHKLAFQTGLKKKRSFSFKLCSLLPDSLGCDIQVADTGALFKTDHTLLGELTLAVLGNPHTVYTSVKQHTRGEQAALIIQQDFSNLDLTAEAVYNQLRRSLEVVAPRRELSQIAVTGVPLSPDESVIIKQGKTPKIIGAYKPRATLNLSKIDISTVDGARATRVVVSSAMKEIQSSHKQLQSAHKELDSALGELGSHMLEEHSTAQDFPSPDSARSTTEKTTGQMQKKVSSTIISQARDMPRYASVLAQSVRGSLSVSSNGQAKKS